MENFISQIIQFLSSHEFTLKDSNEWVLEKSYRTGGSRLVINGQTAEVPGEIIKRNISVELIPGGYIKDSISKTQIDFLQIHFNVIENNTTIVNTDECLYAEDFPVFLKILSSFGVS